MADQSASPEQLRARLSRIEGQIRDSMRMWWRFAPGAAGFGGMVAEPSAEEPTPHP